MTHRDDVADDVTLTEGLNHPDQGQKDGDHSSNQSNFQGLLHGPNFRFEVSITPSSQPDVPREFL